MTREALARQSVLVVTDSGTAHTFAVLLVAPFVHWPATLHGVSFATATIVPGEVPPARTFYYDGI